ncbi:MAG: CaiB/BaiF CoA-transferase family protein [Alphaproteobacteria bacterium]|nr:CaiB/BaiF CoA-transferase family protein [Alphaproteobacteria bacterium]
MSEENSKNGALAGIKVVDLTRVLSGPYATQILADHGAEVIKVEPPLGDEVRDWGPPFYEGDASYFIGLNRNKRSIGIDLRQKEGRDVLLRLLEEADIVFENFKTGQMEKFGLGYEDILKEKFPKLIYCRISGYGADGPLGGFPGYDAVIQSAAGWFSVNGTSNSGPTRVGIPMVDMGTGLYSTIAMLMALEERSRSGQGQFIDMTLYDCAVSLLHPYLANYLLSDKIPQITGNQHPNIAPYDKYPTKSGDIYIACGNNRQFLGLCEVLGQAELADDPRFKDNGDRSQNRDVLTDVLRLAMVNEDGEDLCARLLAKNVPAGPVNDIAQVMSHPHTAHRSMDAKLDWYRGAGTPIKFSRTPGALKSPPPKFGVHSREIMAAHGYSEGDIERMIADGILVEERRK